MAAVGEGGFHTVPPVGKGGGVPEMTPHRTPLQLVLENLHREVTLIERELSLLKEIDQSILNIRTRSEHGFLERLFTDTTRRFTEIHGLGRPLLCYVNTGTEFVLLRNDRDASDYPARIQVTTQFELWNTETNPNPDGVVVLSSGEHPIFEYFDDKTTILLYPMFSEQRHLICVFLVADTADRSASHLTDLAFANSISSIVAQLAIAFNHFDRLVRLETLEQIWATFLESNLSPELCFKAMAHLVPGFLPDFGPIRFQGEGPHVQILLLTESDTNRQELLIRGTMGSEHEGTRIAVDRSITGLLIEYNENELPFFCDDPRNPKDPAHSGRYKEYLGENIRTELAVRLFDHDRVVGVLNLESETPDAFNDPHIAAMRRLGRVIGPMLMVFERRLELASTVQLSVASSTARYLEGLASVYRHSIKTPMTSLKSNIELTTNTVQNGVAHGVERALQLASSGQGAKAVPVLREVVDELNRGRARFDRLLASYTQLRDYNADFVRDISGYSQNGPTNLRALVDESVKLVTDSLLAPLGQQIRLEYVADETDANTRVYCSPLLKQHLYSVFHNAVLAVEDRLKHDPRLGRIWISIAKDELPPGQEVALNTSWAVSIKDNGNGVAPEDLKKLRRFEPGTTFRRGGTGYGLAALHRFVNSIGGRVELHSTYGDGFEVVIHIYVDRPNI